MYKIVLQTSYYFGESLEDSMPESWLRTMRGFDERDWWMWNGSVNDDDKGINGSLNERSSIKNLIKGGSIDERDGKLDGFSGGNRGRSRWWTQIDVHNKGLGWNESMNGSIDKRRWRTRWKIWLFMIGMRALWIRMSNELIDRPIDGRWWRAAFVDEDDEKEINERPDERLYW